MSYKLRAKRVEVGIKQGDMAKFLGVTPQYLCKIENGETSPRLDLMKRISEVLEIPITKLFL